MLQRPADDEYAPYYGTYISLVPDGDVRDHLRMQLHETVAMLSGVSDARGSVAYGPGKWTLKESLLHMIDAERVFTYRLLRDRKSTRLNSSHIQKSRMPSSA